MNTTPAQSAVSVLNRLLEDEPAALYTLMSVGAVVSMKTAKSPDIIVSTALPVGAPVVRFLGVLNGMLYPFGDVVIAVYEDGRLDRFEIRKLLDFQTGQA